MPAVDTLFVGGSVFRGTGGDAVAHGVAVADGRIVAVAPDDELRELAGRGTDVVDLAGGLLTAGFQDAHVHPVFAGALLLQCDLQAAGSADELVARVAAYAQAHPERDWVAGGGWSMEAFPGGRPHRAALDAVLPDRPAFLTNRDGHGAWANSAALRAAGIGRGTPDPPDGRIERDADGEPTGLLHEGAATLVGRLPPATAQDSRAALLAAQAHLRSLGITAWQDAIVGARSRSARTPTWPCTTAIRSPVRRRRSAAPACAARTCRGGWCTRRTDRSPPRPPVPLIMGLLPGR